jgi:hypothetical protein
MPTLVTDVYALYATVLRIRCLFDPRIRNRFFFRIQDLGWIKGRNTVMRVYKLNRFASKCASLHVIVVFFTTLSFSCTVFSDSVLKLLSNVPGPWKPYVFWVSRIQIIICTDPDPSIKKQNNILKNLVFFAIVTSRLRVQL